MCCAIERYTLKASGDDRNRILWTGPKGPGRAKLVIRVSYDEAATFANERLISAEPAAYSDLTVLKDKTVGVLWERGEYKFITFTRLDAGVPGAAISYFERRYNGSRFFSAFNSGPTFLRLYVTLYSTRCFFPG